MDFVHVKDGRANPRGGGASATDVVLMIASGNEMLLNQSPAGVAGGDGLDADAGACGGAQ
jgi:hypothetical protein